MASCGVLTMISTSCPISFTFSIGPEELDLMRNLHYNNLNANIALNTGGKAMELDLVTLGRYLQRQRNAHVP